MKYWAECCLKLTQVDSGLYFACSKIKDHVGQCSVARHEVFTVNNTTFAKFSKWQIEAEGLDPRSYQPVLNENSTPAPAKASCFY